MIYYGNLPQTILVMLLFLIGSIIFAIFSPFSIVFIIFTIVRAKTLSPEFKKLSFAFQIVFMILNILLGIIAGILFLMMSGSSDALLILIPAALGVIFVFLIQLFVIIWQNKSSKDK